MFLAVAKSFDKCAVIFCVPATGPARPIQGIGRCYDDFSGSAQHVENVVVRREHEVEVHGDDGADGVVAVGGVGRAEEGHAPQPLVLEKAHELILREVA